MRYVLSVGIALIFLGLSGAAAQQGSGTAKGATSPEACEKACRAFCEKRVEQKIAPNFQACNGACLNQKCGRGRHR